MSLFLFPHWSRPVCGLAVLLAAPNGIAREAPSTLTLAAALQRTSDHNPALAAARYDGRAAEALTEQAALRPNPTLEVSLENLAGTGRLRGVDDLEATMQASQTFERGDKRVKRMTAARRDRDVVAGAFAVQHADLLVTTALAYVKALTAQQRRALAAEPLDLARETLAAAEARVRAGDASPAEPARARAALASAQLDYNHAESALTRARISLAAQWGGRPADVPVLPGALRVPDALPAEDAFRTGLRAHPRLELQQAIIASRRSGLELEQAQAAGDVTIGAGLRFLRNGSDAGFVAGVSMPMPFRNKNQGNIRAAREQLTGAEQSVVAVENILHSAFTVAWQDLAAAHAAVQNLRREALPATEEAHAFVRRAYAGGQLPLIDVLDAQRALVAVRRDLLEAESAYALALVQLESLTAPTFPATIAILSSP